MAPTGFEPATPGFLLFHLVFLEVLRNRPSVLEEGGLVRGTAFPYDKSPVLYQAELRSLFSST